jgi:hypothetical protein
MYGSFLFRTRFLRCLGGLTAFAFLFQAHALPIDHAKITEVVNNVTLLDPHSWNASPAKTDETFRAPEIMKTGAQSRSELVADDQTITRVGADTLFSFEPHERVINLKEGSILFQAPSGRGGGSIRTAAATASVLGTTMIAVATRDGAFKLLDIEGNVYVRMANGKHVTLHGGQMIFVPPGAHDPGLVLDFRLRDEVATSLLVSSFQAPLPSLNKIRKQIQKQEKQIASGSFGKPGTVLGDIPDPNKRINQSQGLHFNATASAQGGTSLVIVPLFTQPAQTVTKGAGGGSGKPQ